MCVEVLVEEAALDIEADFKTVSLIQERPIVRSGIVRSIKQESSPSQRDKAASGEGGLTPRHYGKPNQSCSNPGQATLRRTLAVFEGVCGQRMNHESSFHSRFREECLDREQLWMLSEAQVVIEDWQSASLRSWLRRDKSAVSCILKKIQGAV